MVTLQSLVTALPTQTHAAGKKIIMNRLSNPPRVRPRGHTLRHVREFITHKHATRRKQPNRCLNLDQLATVTRTVDKILSHRRCRVRLFRREMLPVSARMSPGRVTNEPKPRRQISRQLGRVIPVTQPRTDPPGTDRVVPLEQPRMNRGLIDRVLWVLQRERLPVRMNPQP